MFVQRWCFVGEGLAPPVRGAKPHRALIVSVTADRGETSLPLGGKVSPQVTDEGLTFPFYQLFKGVGTTGVDIIASRR